MTSFDEFRASEEVSHKRCFTCHHPMRDEIEAARASGGSMAQIVRWLKKEGVYLSEGALNNHFVSGHHLEVRSSTSTTLPLKRKSS